MTLPMIEESGAGWRLILGDCLDVMPTLGMVDAVIADPPYGVGFAAWDDEWSPSAFLDVARLLGPSLYITPGIRNLYRWAPPDWIGAYSYPIGLKRSAGGGFNAWEPILVYGRNSMPIDHRQFSPEPSEKVHGHPCPKPLAPFIWLVGTSTDADSTILDPFAGSGTTGVACLRLGRKFIGIEKDPTYFALACERLRAEEQGSTLQASRAGQLSLLGGK